MLEKAIKFEHMLVYNMQGLKKKNWVQNTKKTIPLCRGSVLALGKGALCREPALQRSAKVRLCREPNGAAIGKGDDNGSRPLRGSFAQSLSLPRVKLSAKLAFAERLALPRAEPSAKTLCRGSLLAVGEGCLCRGPALGKAGPSAKLPFPVVIRCIGEDSENKVSCHLWIDASESNV